MKFIKELLSVLVLSAFSITANSQKFRAGFYSGINFSAIHGQEYGGKWTSLPGPTAGLSLRYNFLKPFTFVTGISYSGINYKYTSFSYPYYPDFFYRNYYDPAYNSIIAPVGSHGTVTNLGFTRIPLLLEINIPSSLDFRLGAGILFSFTGGGNSSGNYLNSYSSGKLNYKDFGFMYSAGWDYPIAEKLEAGLDIKYVASRKAFVENGNLRHGYSEISFGLSYKFGGKEVGLEGNRSVKDSTSSSAFLTYFAGPSFSWIKDTRGEGGYLPLLAHSIGFNLTFPFNGGASFTTGARFERIGYGIQDSSNHYYLITGDSKRTYYDDTRVSTDRLVIPFLLDIPFGHLKRIYFSTGPLLAFKLNGRNTGTAFAEGRWESNYSIRKITVYDDMEKVLNDFDTGWIFGGSFLFPLKCDYLVKLSLNYSAGFRDFYEKSSVSELSYPDGEGLGLRNRTISLTLGIVVPSSKKGEGRK
jgi:hypothetical protein